MLFLILHVLLLSSFGLVAKHYQASGRNLLSIGAVNYAFAAVVAALSIIYKGSFRFSITICIIGVLAGIAYSTSYFLMIKAIKSSGISITWSVIRLSILIPILFSIFVWHESPSIYQIMGIACMCVSLPLLSIRHNEGSTHRAFGKASLLIIVLFIAVGGDNLAPKVFNELSPESHRQTYLLFLFSTAAITSGCMLIFTRSSPKLPDIPVGMGLGLCNLLARYFLLLALTRLPGVVVFPISGSLGIVLIALAGMVIWKEKLKGLNILGIAFAIITVVLISLE